MYTQNMITRARDLHKHVGQEIIVANRNDILIGKLLSAKEDGKCIRISILSARGIVETADVSPWREATIMDEHEQWED